MTDPLWLLAALVLAFVLAAVLCRLVIGLGLVDAPTEARKIQTAPVPTSGGLGFAVAAIGSALATSFFVAWSARPEVLAVVGGGLAALALGLADDRFTLPARVKLILMLTICLAMTASGVRTGALHPWPDMVWTLPLALSAAGCILWLVVVVNAVNFMDGANGLAMGMAAISAVGFSACGIVAGAWDIALVSGALAGALGGFLVWNIPGRLFAGDAGALFVGAMFAGLSLLLVKLRPDWLFIPPVLLMPFLTDVLLTLAWRAKHRKPLFSAHRDHAYQIAMKAGLKHWQVAAIHAVWMGNAVAMAVVAAIAAGHVPLFVFLALLAASTWVHLRVRASGVKAGLVGARIP